MPPADEILRELTEISRRGMAVALLWHLALGGVLVALARGFRPSKRLAGSLLALPLASVSLLALLHHNPFNALGLGAGALGLLVLGLRLPTAKAERASTTLTVWALLLVEFGWVYPHFLGEQLSLTYFYAAPLGVVPCPTLAAVTGLSMLARGFDTRAWPTLLGCLGLFYGAFGALRLGVAIDALLAVGALILLGAAWSRSYAAPTSPRTASA